MPFASGLALAVLFMVLVILLLFCWDCHGNQCYDS